MIVVEFPLKNPLEEFLYVKHLNHGLFQVAPIPANDNYPGIKIILLHFPAPAQCEELASEREGVRKKDRQSRLIVFAQWNGMPNTQIANNVQNKQTETLSRRRLDDRVDGSMDLLWNEVAMCTLFAADSRKVLHFWQRYYAVSIRIVQGLEIRRIGGSEAGCAVMRLSVSSHGP